MKNKIIAEFFGSVLLLAVITGSGIMGESLSAGNAAVALLGNSITTGCGLYVLITLLAPLSGAHFNPVVSIMLWRTGVLNMQTLFGYIFAQFAGAISGVWLTHLMFGLPVIQASTKPRHGLGIWLSELVATLVLLCVIRLGVKHANDKVAMLVALTVTAGYWFTSSTFFANPAVTLARCLTNTFVGINPADVAGFVSAQAVAVLLVSILMKAGTI
jgi:glycerol uptake facilitator-like aquaporin